MTKHPLLLRITPLPVGRRASGFVLVAKGGGIRPGLNQIVPAASMKIWRNVRILRQVRGRYWGSKAASSSGVYVTFPKSAARIQELNLRGLGKFPGGRENLKPCGSVGVVEPMPGTRGSESERPGSVLLRRFARYRPGGVVVLRAP